MSSPSPLNPSQFEPLLPGATVAGRYTVLQPLGQGGMGVVLAAYDARLDRRVALKLVQPRDSDSEALKLRLLREAQAMARLSHPNVVHVYDTGALEDGRLFIAMQYVEGQTLSEWYLERQRSWRELMEVFLAAGRGLVAAHEAGLVHRDFKPDNVLVGRDGQVRVTDFGVARTEPSLSSEPAALTPPPGSEGSWEQALTLPGALLGTPRYMAPELLAGQPADARSDLFSFCTALYEALYGQPPFGGNNLQERAQAMAEGPPAVPPARSGVPAWVARALLRGLQVQPALRPASMRELIAALEEDPQVRRRARLRVAALSAGGLCLGVLALAGWLYRWGPGESCTRLERYLEGVWDEAVQARVRQSLVGTGLPYAEDTYQRVAAELGEYAGTWVRLRTEVCRADQAQAGSSQALAALQVRCLERRRSRLQALTELLGRGTDTELLPKAVQSVQSLPPLADCMDVAVLTAAVPPPEEPAVRARVEALQAQVDRLAVLESAGKYSEGLALAGELLPRAQELGHVPSRAQVLYWLGWLQERVGDYTRSEAVTREAIKLASASGDSILEVQAWSLMGLLVFNRQFRYQEAPMLVLAMEAAVERARDERARADLFASLGNAYLSMSRYEEARAWHERALSLREKLLEAEHHDIGSSHANLGIVLSRLGRYEEGRSHFERALAIREKALGPEHPLIPMQLNNLGNALQVLGRLEEARAHFERALRIQQKVVSPEHPNLAITLNNLAGVLMDLEHYREARVYYERALALRQKVLGARHPEVATSLSNLGLALLELGQYREAREHLEHALALRQEALDPAHLDLAYSYQYLGLVLLESGRYPEARARFELALSLRQRALGPDNPELVETLTGLGRTLVRLQQWEQARRYLEQGYTLLERSLGREHASLAPVLLGQGELLLAQGQPAQALPLLERALALRPRAETGLALARALWDSGSNRPRALELARQAEEHSQRVGHQPRAAEASRWLAAHTSP